MGDAGFISSAVRPGHAPRRVEPVFAGTMLLAQIQKIGMDSSEVMTMIDLARIRKHLGRVIDFLEKGLRGRRSSRSSKKLEAGPGVQGYLEV